MNWWLIGSGVGLMTPPLGLALFFSCREIVRQWHKDPAAVVIPASCASFITGVALFAAAIAP